MRSLISIFWASLLLLSSCSSAGMKGNPAAVMVGSRVGGLIGGIVGNPHGRNYTGHMLGTVIGTVTGATVANILTTPREQIEEDEFNAHEESQPIPDSPFSRLSIRNIRFIDANRNHVIESGENCQLVFLVMNKGDYPIYNVTPIVQEIAGLKHLYISPTVSVEKIAPGEGIKYTANIRAARKLKTGEAIFQIYALEGDGASSTVKEFVLPTLRVKN